MPASSASTNIFGQEEEEEEDQSDHPEHSKLEYSDEEVKSKPAVWELPAAVLTEGRRGGGGEASSRRLLLKEPSEDLQVTIVRREKVEEKDSYIRYMICTQVSCC